MNFKQLLLAAKSGDSDAIEQLLNMYNPLITRYSFINNIFDEDLHQEQMLKVFNCVKKFSEKYLNNCNEEP